MVTKPAALRADWLVLSIQASPSGAEVDLNAVRSYRKPAGSGPVSSAHASVDTTAGVAYVVVNNGHNSETRLSTSRGLGGVERVQPLTSFDDPRGTGGVSGRLTLGPCERYRDAFFLPGGTIDTSVASLRVRRGQASLSAAYGRGSSTAEPAAPSSEGYAVAVGPVVAGASTVRARVPLAIVGGIDVDCQVCRGTTTAPGQPARPWQSESPGIGPGSFAGPAGSWTWTFEGVDVGRNLAVDRPSVVVWAPLGPLAADWQRWQ